MSDGWLVDTLGQLVVAWGDWKWPVRWSSFKWWKVVDSFVYFCLLGGSQSSQRHFLIINKMKINSQLEMSLAQFSPSLFNIIIGVTQGSAPMQ